MLTELERAFSARLPGDIVPSDCGVEGPVADDCESSGEFAPETGDIEKDEVGGERRKSGVLEDGICGEIAALSSNTAADSNSEEAADGWIGESDVSSSSPSFDFSSAFRFSIHHTALAESQAFVLTLCIICPVSNPSFSKSSSSRWSSAVEKGGGLGVVSCAK
jgi:hypothetical protein